MSNLATYDAVRKDLEASKNEIARVLPPHVPIERFVRVALTTCQLNPQLFETCERKSLMGSFMKCAQDGLIPDGREAAIVPFKGQATYLPMIAGVLKKLRNSGELLSISVHVVYQKDKFDYSLGDEEHIHHTPYLDDDPGAEKLAYAVVKTKDGGIYREVMTRKEIEKVRNVSRASNGPAWTQWWGEMAKKTVIKRLAKRLPSSADVDDFIQRDNEIEVDPATLRPANGKVVEDVQPTPGTPNDNPPQTQTQKLKDDLKAKVKPASSAPAAEVAAKQTAAAAAFFPGATAAPAEQQELTAEATVVEDAPKTEIAPPAPAAEAPKADAEKPKAAAKAKKSTSAAASTPPPPPPPTPEPSNEAPPPSEIPGGDEVSSEGEIKTERRTLKKWSINGVKRGDVKIARVTCVDTSDHFYTSDVEMARPLIGLAKGENPPAIELEFYTSKEDERIFTGFVEIEDAPTFSAGDTENPLT